MGRPGDDEFLALVAATDLGVALRRPPTHGERPAALLDLLRSGVPAVVTDTGSFSEYPDGVVRKVPWDDDGAGVAALTRALLDLAADPAARAALGRAGLDHVRAHHAWPRVAARYAEVIDWSTRVRRDVAAHLLPRPPPRRAGGDGAPPRPTESEVSDEAAQAGDPGADRSDPAQGQRADRGAGLPGLDPGDQETRWMAPRVGPDRAMNQALAAYVPPTPWAEAWVDEVTQVLDSVIAEQFRLQSQVEELERLLREALAERVGTTDDRVTRSPGAA